MRKIVEMLGHAALGPIVVAVFLVCVPTEAQADVASFCAAVPAGSTRDTDVDGLSDVVECQATGVSLNLGASATTLPRCIGGETGAARAACIDPQSKDVFIILVPASPSLLPANPFEYIANSTILNLAVHQISPNQVNSERTITSVSIQKAVQITESLAPGQILGAANFGTPNGLDFATVYTQRIKDFVNSVYNNAGNTTTDRQPVINTYIKHTLAHEFGHVQALSAKYDSRFNGNHYAPGSGTMMEQNIKYTVKGGNVTWSIGTVYAAGDKACETRIDTANPSTCLP